ncbi:hypothetical protein GR294_24375, partial [Raoultella sp. Lac2]|nr:hypothetical protein [Raoultella sp. Lac2]
MNNELTAALATIEQIAEQNGMTVEFVTWFFNEKKSACGEHWFLALGAMWEGWKGRSAESTAALATIEKLRAERDQLAAENVALKSFGDTLFGMYKGLEISGGGIHDEQSVVCQQAALDAAMSAFEEIETPATNAAIAGIKAAIEYPKNSTPSNGWTIDPGFLSRVVERAGAVYGYHPGLEEAESALLAGLY